MRWTPALLALGLLAAPAAFAQDDEPGDETEEDEGDDTVVLSEEPAAAPAAPKEKVEWDTQPFIRPAIGGGVFSDGSDTYLMAALGAQAGLRFWQKKPDPKIVGLTRVLGQYIVGSGVSGYQVRVGAFAGPWYKVIGLRTGPDIFYNQYTFGTYELDASPGLSWPVIAMLDFKVINFQAGVEPAFFFNSARPTVDWSSEPSFGFGGEFTYLAGVGLDLDAIGLSLSYTDRITAYGHDKGFGVGFRVGG